MHMHHGIIGMYWCHGCAGIMGMYWYHGYVLGGIMGIYWYCMYHGCVLVWACTYSSPPLIRPTYLPRNSGHIREVAFGERER